MCYLICAMLFDAQFSAVKPVMILMILLLLLLGQSNMLQKKLFVFY